MKDFDWLANQDNSSDHTPQCSCYNFANAKIVRNKTFNQRCDLKLYSEQFI